MSEIHSLFPTAVYRTNLARLLTTEEETFLRSCHLSSQELGNKSSNNKTLLNEPELKEIKKFIEIHLQDYQTNIISSDVRLYLTNSWLNITNTGESHLLHNHTNSIISGVLYLKVEDSQSTISFNRMTPPFLLNLNPYTFNPFNSIEWNLEIKNYDLILFPSSMYHYVKTNTSDNARISLAFNTFLKGNIGGIEPGADLLL